MLTLIISGESPGEDLFHQNEYQNEMHFKHKYVYNVLRATVFYPFQLKAISRLPYVLALHFKLDGSIIDILF